MARDHPVWLHAWGMLDGGFAGTLAKAGLQDPLMWAGLRGNRGCLVLMLDSMGLTAGKDPGYVTQMLNQCEVRQAAVRNVGDAWIEQHGATYG